jgi:serine/threonine protein kinase
VVITSLLLALDSIHKEGIAHRDVKPENILIYNDETKFIDFGLSCDSTTAITQFSGGTVKYICPKLLSIHESNLEFYQRCDKWSLAVIIIEIILGEHPYRCYELIYDIENISNKMYTRFIHKIITPEFYLDILTNIRIVMFREKFPVLGNLVYEYFNGQLITKQ